MPVITISGMPWRLITGRIVSSSSVSPELDSASTTSVGDHAEIAVARFARMHEERGRAGRGQRRGDLARDVAGLAHAGARRRGRLQSRISRQAAMNAPIDARVQRSDGRGTSAAITCAPLAAISSGFGRPVAGLSIRGVARALCCLGGGLPVRRSKRRPAPLPLAVAHFSVIGTYFPQFAGVARASSMDSTSIRQ